MRDEETNARMARIYARKRLATDPAVRAKFALCIEAIRELIGERADENGWHVLAQAAQIAADLEFSTVTDIILESGIDADDLPERQPARVIKKDGDDQITCNPCHAGRPRRGSVAGAARLDGSRHSAVLARPATAGQARR